MFGLGPLELCLIGAIAVMLYGKRLPEVGRSVGGALAEFRRQWATISQDLDVTSHINGSPSDSNASARRIRNSDVSDRVESSHVATPRFDPPKSSEEQE